MMSRYKEVAKFVFDYREHRNPLVRQSITALLPRIAHFLRDRFVSSYLQVRNDIIVSFATSMPGSFRVMCPAHCIGEIWCRVCRFMNWCLMIENLITMFANFGCLVELGLVV